MDNGGEMAAERQLKRAAKVVQVMGLNALCNRAWRLSWAWDHKVCFLLLFRCIESKGTGGEEGESTTRCRPAWTGTASIFAS